MFNVPLIIGHTIVALVICLIAGKFHEVLHVVVAKKYGYKIKSFALWKNEVDVDIEADDPNLKKIANAPYFVMFPLGVCLILVGWFIDFLGILVAGVGIILMHSVTVFLEGREERGMQKLQKESNSDNLQEKE